MNDGLTTLLGLLVASVGLNNPAAIPRFTFGSTELMGGIGLIPIGPSSIVARKPVRNGNVGISEMISGRVKRE